MNYGFIYCLGNDCMPGVYKIGMTDRAPSQRAYELSGATAAPTPFSLLCFGEVNDAQRIERELHAEFSAARVSKNREFFRVDYREIYDVFRSYSSALAETFEGSTEAARTNLMMHFYAATNTEKKIEFLLDALSFAGVRIWSDQDTIRTSQNLSLDSWMTGALVGLKKDLLPVIPRKEPVTKLMTLIKTQETSTQELDW